MASFERGAPRERPRSPPCSASSRQNVVRQADRFQQASAVHGHGGFCNPASCDGIVVDLGIPCAANEDAAVRGFAIKFAGIKTATNEGLADHITNDAHAVGVAGAGV